MKKPAELSDPAVIGKRIRAERLKAKMTIEQLAEQTGTSANYLGNIERGQDIPGLAVLLSIANALNASVDYLLGDNLSHNSCLHDDVQDAYTKKILHECEDLSESEKQYFTDSIVLYKHMKTKQASPCSISG